MLDQFTFTLTRLRYLYAAQQNIPTFKPDGKNADDTADQLTAATAAGDEFLLKFNAYNTANGTLAAQLDIAHEAAVTVYACMKSCYRKDISCSAAIVRLPKQDRSPEVTLKRMRALTACWSTLPSVPGTTDPFTVGPWTYATFGAAAQTLENKISAADLARSVYAGAIATLNSKDAEWNNFVTAALTQGRAMYRPGTPERAYIDRIPTEPSTQEPAEPVITVATSPAPGAVHLEFEANHATSFQVWHKGPGSGLFVKVDDVLLPGAYDTTGLVPGAHEYQIVGENSRGTGPTSLPSTVNVLLSAVA